MEKTSSQERAAMDMVAVTSLFFNCSDGLDSSPQKKAIQKSYEGTRPPGFLLLRIAAEKVETRWKNKQNTFNGIA